MVSGVQTPSQRPEVGQSPEMWACKHLRTKHFHRVSSGNQHPYLLKSRYGKVSVVGLWRVNKRTPELCQEQVGRYTLDASMLGSRFYAVRSVLRPHHRPEGERAGPTIHGFYMEHRALTAHCRQLAGERLLERARPQFLQSSLHRVSIAGLQATLRLLSLWSANCPPLYWRKLWG